MKTFFSLTLAILYIISLPDRVHAQNPQKIDWIKHDFNFQDSMKTQFGNGVIKEMDKMSSNLEFFSLGLLQLSSPEIQKENTREDIFRGSCLCLLENDTLQVSNAIGFMAGIASVTKINTRTKLADSYIQLNSDGEKSDRLRWEDEYVADLKIPYIDYQVEILKKSRFSHGEFVSGRITGETVKYYNKSYSGKQDKELSLIVKSIFQCKVIEPSKIELELKRMNKKKN